MTVDVKKDFRGKKVFLIGDPMIDVYMWGASTRMSPEAPVPVVAIEKTEARLGGAANVALNLKALGADPILVATLPSGASGTRFKSLMEEAGISLEGLFFDEKRSIPVKTRIINNDQHVLRVDEEVISPVSDEVAFLAHCEHLFENNIFDVVIFQDYNKGLLAPSIIQQILTFSKRFSIPTVVDPKKEHFFSYVGVTLFKPNLKELSEGLFQTIPASDAKVLAAALEKARQKLQAYAVMTSLSEHGIAVATSSLFEKQPAYQRKIKDVSGAGDSVVSVAALALACGYSLSSIAKYANLAGGLVCEHVGVVPITIDTLCQAIATESDTPTL